MKSRHDQSFVPWLAALIIGATSHAGWLIHELRSDNHAEPSAPTVIVNVEVDEPAASDRPTRMLPRCRHARGDPPSHAHDGDESLDFDLWIHQTGRYSYAIDHRALEQVAFARGDFGHGELIELRNVRRDTLLFHLGLRNGDRLLAVAVEGDDPPDRVTLSLERRGRRLALTYEIV